jgi:hypothetical protein
MTDTDIDIAADIRVRLNTAILALQSALDITPQRNPFREADALIAEALAAARQARLLCQQSLVK